MTVIMYFLMNCVIIMGFFFIWIFTIRAQRCKEDYLSYFVAFFSIRNQFALQDRLNAPRTTSVKDVVFPVLRNRRVSHQLRHYRKTTRVSLNCSKVRQGIAVIHTVFNSCLAASFLNKQNPIFFWEILRLLFFTPSARPVLRWSNDMIHQVLVRLDRKDVPTL